jgi:hypothetical protein
LHIRFIGTIFFRRKWAAQLSGRMKNSKWLYSIVRPVVQGQYTQEDYNRDMNILFIKLHLLDPATVMPTYHHVRKGKQHTKNRVTWSEQ